MRDLNWDAVIDVAWQPDWCARRGDAAVNAGLTRMPVSETIRDTLTWERRQGLDRVRKSGMTAEREADLVRKLVRP